MMEKSLMSFSEFQILGARVLWFPLTSGQFIKVTEVSRKSVMKLPQKSMLHEFVKACEAEIWTRVRRRYLTSICWSQF